VPQNEIYAYQTYEADNYAYFQFNALHDKVDVIDGIGSYAKPWLQPVAKAYVNRQFKKKNPSKKIAPYYNSNYPVFRDFAWELVDSLNNNKIDNLIIDLRYSAGGNLMLGLQLMYFLTNKDDLKGFNEYAYTSKVYKNYFPNEYKQLQENADSELRDNELVLINSTNGLFDTIKDSTSVYYVPADRPVYNGNIIVLANYNTEAHPHCSLPYFKTMRWLP